MDISLQSPTPPVEILSGYVSEDEKTLALHCHDDTFKAATVFNAEGNPVFRVEGTSFGKSWSWRRKVFDAAYDRHLFDFRHENFDFKNRWVLEDNTGRKFGSFVHKSQLTTNHSAIDATVRTTAGEDVLVTMRPRDAAALTVAVTVNDTTIAAIGKVADNRNTLSHKGDSTVWSIRVAAATDLTLIVALALCRAEMGHVWNQ
ncbi:hypothetical protein F5B22DRAFT_473586 [Xylaria bambusicola]|uniref:uncharacterized protein n=1 Tax=Xylaria bambusicola TaxID=326684 RepID=UPI0020080D0A|nr:uncharacterized protein F5B22DRAFT_473586 [Xylaria bambusicola]KAI0506243.1 hypothetical protein F5B22DRAFT_473586 [Xylaria bambusicola]